MFLVQVVRVYLSLFATWCSHENKCRGPQAQPACSCDAENAFLSQHLPRCPTLNLVRSRDRRVLFCVFVLHDDIQRELVCERAPPPRHFVSLSYLFCNPSLTLPLQVLATFAHSVSRQTSHSTMHIMSCVCVFFFFLHFTFNRTKSQSR